MSRFPVFQLPSLPDDAVVGRIEVALALDDLLGLVVVQVSAHYGLLDRLAHYTLVGGIAQRYHSRLSPMCLGFESWLC